uniref:Rac/Cdc42 guanine nucleotide exchange factor 6 n=1 Tax=Callorhinchus milii TaxID=7868 RepID=A0A4W3ID18_CALMI
MTPAEQNVTWLISLGVLDSPKKTVSDPEEFLKASLKDGMVLCKLLERFLLTLIYVYDLYRGQNISKVLNTLSAFNKATEGKICGYQLVVKARFQFKQTNEDELSFSKGDIVYVTRVEDGGWWEGTCKGKTGWFPSNYVREFKTSEKPVSPKGSKGFEPPSVCKNYYGLVIQNIVENERDYSKELQNLLGTYLRSLQANDKLSAVDIVALRGNLEEICTYQQTLYQALEECAKLPEPQQKVAGCFLNLMPQMKSLYLSYCANHPAAVGVLTQHRDELDKFMESQGAASPGSLILTTSLSKPFVRLGKYPALLQELERHVEESHPDRSNILKAMTSFKSLVDQCEELRKRKLLELQILSEHIQGWEGEDIKSLGTVIYMSQVMVQCGASEEKDERYFMLFPTVLLMLSASPCMSGFLYQGKLPLTGMTVTKLEDSENFHYAFEITGNMIERIMVSCNSIQELQDWVENLHMLTKGTISGTATSKPLSGTSQTAFLCSSIYFFPSSSLLPLDSHGESKQPPATPSHQTPPYSPPLTYNTAGQNRGPLEPPKISKPWTLSCLRPAPPLRPSAALGYKEESSKSPRTVKKFLPKRKTERKTSDDEFILRKSTAALEEDAQILKVIEAYCTSANLQQTHRSEYITTSVLFTVCRKESTPQVLLPEEEKIIVEETKSNGQTVIEEKSLVDTVYALKDEVQELKQENKRMKQSLEEEQKSRKELEKMIRKVLKQLNESVWDDTNH